MLHAVLHSVHILDEDEMCMPWNCWNLNSTYNVQIQDSYSRSVYEICIGNTVRLNQSTGGQDNSWIGE